MLDCTQQMLHFPILPKVVPATVLSAGGAQLKRNTDVYLLRLTDLCSSWAANLKPSGTRDAHYLIAQATSL